MYGRCSNSSHTYVLIVGVHYSHNILQSCHYYFNDAFSDVLLTIKKVIIYWNV